MGIPIHILFSLFDVRFFADILHFWRVHESGHTKLRMMSSRALERVGFERVQRACVILRCTTGQQNLKWLWPILCWACCTTFLHVVVTTSNTRGHCNSTMSFALNGHDPFSVEIFIAIVCYSKHANRYRIEFFFWQMHKTRTKLMNDLITYYVPKVYKVKAHSIKVDEWH